MYRSMYRKKRAAKNPTNGGFLRINGGTFSAVEDKRAMRLGIHPRILPYPGGAFAGVHDRSACQTRKIAP